MNDTLSCTLLSPMNSNDADFKQTFHHSKHGNYQPITWESVLLLSCAGILPGTQLKFSQMGVLHKSLVHRTFYQTWGGKNLSNFPKWKKEALFVRCHSILTVERPVFMMCCFCAMITVEVRDFFKSDIQPIYFAVALSVYSYTLQIFVQAPLTSTSTFQHVN